MAGGGRIFEKEEEEQDSDGLDYAIPDVSGLIQIADEEYIKELQSEHSQEEEEDKKQGKKKKQKRGGTLCICQAEGCTIGPMQEVGG